MSEIVLSAFVTAAAFHILTSCELIKESDRHFICEAMLKYNGVDCTLDTIAAD